MFQVESTILKTFLQAGGEPVSGDRIAKALGVSRVSVWSRLERLRKEGFEFEATTRVGYRLTGLPKKLHPALLDAYLRLAGVSAELHCFAEIDSTNSEAERRLSAGETPPLVIAASQQSAGRGRLGRVWQSGDSGNIYVSFAFRPFLTPERMQSFTLAMGLRLCDFLATRHKLDMKIKWPNDLMCEGRKMAGMLTEARVDADHVRDLVYGLGLNVNSSPLDLPTELRKTAGSLAHALGHTLDINQTAAEIITTALSAYEDFIQTGRGDDFPKLWKKYDILAEKEVTVSCFGRLVTGVVKGIDSSGALLLRDNDNGKVHSFNAGEVTIVKK
ncbi:MAG: biotin--[acetyl-CoA-carboxylase] ligase [Puniceicoccales bacterium]|jgi:BirA family biotin operon repressor/biotin-[acetyl-CoA-carboxylase] ligase|nr:biotin--[acetyl-CoA-carboxylase] ligase [Puniceicoccales bacterium]